MQHIASARASRPAVLDLGAIRQEMALSLVGRAVNLLAGARRVTTGVVTGVLTEAGVTKLIVGGISYNLDQILTAVPPALN